jgi:hypothetical protein
VAAENPDATLRTRSVRVQRNEGRWLKAEMFPPDYAEIVIIRDVRREKVGEDKRYTLYFQDREKALPMNATNIDALIALFGEESTGWIGQRIELFTAWTSYAGRQTLGLRLRPPPVDPRRTAAPPPPTPAPAPPTPGPRVVGRDRAPGEDDEPLTARAIRW